MFCVIKLILAWFILLYIGTNLVGYVVRNFLSWSSPVIDLREPFKKMFTHELRRERALDIAISLIFLVLTVAYLIAIYHFWNVGLAVSAGLVMVGRLPNLLWEIRTGTKISTANYPKGAVSVMSIVLILLSLPLTWYSLCKWTP
jgi:hypothetical protein